MKQLLIATTNPGKLKEISGFFIDSGISILSLKDFPGAPDVEETGFTFEENAVLKAKEYFKLFGIPTLADDGGLEIDALNGGPGVKSRRWIGREMTDWELVDYALEQLKDVPLEKRTASFRVVMAFYDGKNCITDNDALRGLIIADRPITVEPGFPFRSLFFVPQFGKLVKDLAKEEHELINHRLKVLNRLKPIIEKKLK